MAENLNYAASGSKCGDVNFLSNNDTQFCSNYGRLYDWLTAMQDICPSGWHLPSRAELDALLRYEDNAARLKTINGWDDSGGTGNTDDHGFSASPGGVGYEIYFNGDGNEGRWWSATEFEQSYPPNYAYGLKINNGPNPIIENSDKSINLYSVRCLKN